MSINIMKNTMVEMTWCEVDALAKKNAVVLLPIGVIEEHSRHLPLGTDIYLAVSQCESIARELEAGGLPCVIAPPFYWGTTGVITKHFAGSFCSKHETIKAVITDILESLEKFGFRNALAINSHGDPLHRNAIIEAFKEYNSSHELNVRWQTFEDFLEEEGFKGGEDYVLALPPYPFEKLAMSSKSPRDCFDVHAGAFETALMRDTFPELTDIELAEKLQPTMLKDEQIGQWVSGEERYASLLPDGHAGDPAEYRFMKTDLKSANRTMAYGIMDFYNKLRGNEAEIFDNEYCTVKYLPENNAVYLAWKKFSSGDNYRRPTGYALELLKRHDKSTFIIDARNGFEDDKADVEWGFSELLPNMAKTSCSRCIMIMEKANDIKDEMDMWTREFMKYFTVIHVTTLEEATDALKKI